jgi:hypothetical protein
MLPRIIGRMPKMSLPGFHVVPSRNLSGPILNRVGTPLANRKMQISATARMDTQAQRVNTPCITPSFSLEVIFLYSLCS